MSETPPIQESSSCKLDECCLNCNHRLALNAKFCDQCGQRNRSSQITLWSLIGDFAIQQFSLESRLVRTVWELIFHPGRLTLDYWNGKRSRYVSPIQIYLIASVLFFVLVGLGSKFSGESAFQVEEPDWEEFINSEQDGFKVSFGFSGNQLTREQFVEFMETDPNEIEAFFVKHEFEVDAVGLYFAKLSHRFFRPGGLTNFLSAYMSTISQTVIVLMPLFGLILYVLYFWKAKSSVLCIVFSAHLHALAYFAMVLIILLRFVWPSAFVQPLMVLGLLAYFVVAQRRVFGGHWIVILIKSAMASAVYFACVVGFVILLIPFVTLTF